MRAEPKPYAKGTKTTVSATREQIEKELRRYGATDFGFIGRETEAVVGFRVGGTSVRFRVPYPDRESFRMTERRPNQHSAPRPVRRSDGDVEALWEQEAQRRWRSLYACIKAKLIAISDGVETFEQAFFAHVVDPGTGRTLHEVIGPALALRQQGRDVPLLEPPRTGVNDDR